MNSYGTESHLSLSIVGQRIACNNRPKEPNLKEFWSLPAWRPVQTSSKDFLDRAHTVVRLQRRIVQSPLFSWWWEPSQVGWPSRTGGCFDCTAPDSRLRSVGNAFHSRTSHSRRSKSSTKLATSAAFPNASLSTHSPSTLSVQWGSWTWMCFSPFLLRILSSQWAFLCCSRIEYRSSSHLRLTLPAPSEMSPARTAVVAPMSS